MTAGSTAAARRRRRLRFVRRTPPLCCLQRPAAWAPRPPCRSSSRRGCPRCWSWMGRPSFEARGAAAALPRRPLRLCRPRRSRPAATPAPRAQSGMQLSGATEMRLGSAAGSLGQLLAAQEAPVLCRANEWGLERVLEWYWRGEERARHAAARARLQMFVRCTGLYTGSRLGWPICAFCDVIVYIPYIYDCSCVGAQAVEMPAGVAFPLLMLNFPTCLLFPMLPPPFCVLRFSHISISSYMRRMLPDRAARLLGAACWGPEA